MKRSTLLLPALFLAAMALGLSACAGMHASLSRMQKPPVFQPRNFTGVVRLPDSVRRVVLLPVAGIDGVPDETLASFDPLVSAELQRMARFEVVPVDATALRRLCDHPRLLSSDALPPHLLSLLANAYAAEAVMFVDVTDFSAYQPLTVGFRAKLVTIRDGSILWAFDTLFTAADPATANAALEHERQYHPWNEPGDTGSTVLRSPARFADYAASAAFATLPPR